jgi:type I restriction enzyme M protein
MLTGEIRSQIDQIWNAFRSGGIANPLEVIEQITYLLFIKRLDEQETAQELAANSEKKPMDKRFFPQGKDSKKRPYQDFRWTRFKNLEAREMYTVISEHIFPWLRTLGGNGSTYAKHKEGARFTIPPGPLLAKVVDMIDKVPMEDRDTLDLGRPELSPTVGAGLLRKRRVGTLDSAPHHPHFAGRRRNQQSHRRTLLPGTRHPPHWRSL